MMVLVAEGRVCTLRGSFRTLKRVPVLELGRQNPGGAAPTYPGLPTALN